MYYCPHTRAIIARLKRKKVDLNIANLQMGQIYTMLEETVYLPICRWVSNLQLGIHSVNSQMGQVNLQMGQIYRKVGT